jgi:autotransporter-associated beta strand protein
MKSSLNRFLTGPAIAAALFSVPTLAADLTWNTSNPANTVWTTAGVWDGPTTWTNGDTATFNTSATVNIGANISQTGITIASGQTLTLNNTTTVKITGAGTINGNLTKTNNANLLLSHSGGFNGTLGINGQWVILGSAAADPTGQTSIQTKVNIIAGGLILGSAYNGGSATIGELSGAGSIRADWADGGTNNHRRLIVDQTTNSTFSGTFNAGSSGRGLHLTKSGSGTLTVSNNAALTSGADGLRDIAVTGGTLKITGSTGSNSPLNNIAGTSLAISSGATFEAANTTSGIPTGITKAISGSGTFLRSAAGNLVISGEAANSGFSGTWKSTAGTFGFLSETSMGGSSGVTLDGGGLFMNANGANISSSKTITLEAGGGFFDGSTAWSQTWSAKITGDGGFTKRSGMLLTIDNPDNDYTGSTTIQAGTLKLGHADAIATSSQIIVGASTTLDVSAVSWTLGTNQILSGSGNIVGPANIAGTHSPGSSPGTQSFSNGLNYADSSTLLWELTDNTTGSRGTTFDAVNLTGGALTITPGATIDLSFGGTVDFLNAFWSTTQEWLVIDLSSSSTAADSNLFTIGTITGGSNYDAALGSFSILRQPGSNTADSLYLTWTPIPEPASALLGAIGFLIILRRRR